ncbi:MAG TPA: hypothetical protein DHV17_07740 [Chitinophagaceae bacterium]|nr:hypothetical protein [Chitinophagaceae bacterium]
MLPSKNIFSSLLILMLLLPGLHITAQNVGIGTNQPKARLHVADSAVLFSTSTTGTTAPYANPPMEGPGHRMMWYPAKAAFRAGSAFFEWDKNNIGDFSTAFGSQNTASGMYSFSTGYLNRATNTSSVSFGSSTLASGTASTSFGELTTASGFVSTSFGYNTTASGFISTSLGNYTFARGFSSTSIGEGTIAKARGAVSLGLYNDSTDNPITSSFNNADRIFQIGNGTDLNARKNAVTVLRNGHVGIGELSPEFVLDVKGRMRIQSNNSLSAGINLNNDANSDLAAFMGMRSTNNEVGFYGYTGTLGWRFLVNTTTGNAWMQGTLTQNSDIRLKKNIKPLTHTLAAIQQLKGYSYHWKDPNNPDEQIGLLAQELQKVYPQLVKENNNGDLSVNYSGLIPVLLEAIKELHQKVAELESKLK